MQHVAQECAPCGALTIFSEDATYPRRCARCGSRLAQVRWERAEGAGAACVFARAIESDRPLRPLPAQALSGD